ncbi:hypothetical protein COB55_05125 [Candidatus Wolfebacteria bacterium]|nr:MAG: hypothetical protein COB55_05125 [Candidatus Wolfebacteria bacterium]
MAVKIIQTSKSPLKVLNPIIVKDKQVKQVISDSVKLRQRTETRKIKFKKNLEYIESGDTLFYQNLDITVKLDRMIKYILAESSKDKKGIIIDNKFDNNLKSPFADFWSEVFVHVERSDGTDEIIRKEIEFVPDSGSHDEMIRFSRFFNINQVIDEKNNRLTNDNNILGSVKGDIDVFRSPFVLTLSSYDNKPNKHSSDFSTELIPGAGIGGVIIQPESYGYYSNVHSGGTSSENVGTNTYFRTGDIEKEFDFEQSNVGDKRTISYITPSVMVGQQFNLDSQYKTELIQTNKSVLLGRVEGTGGKNEPVLEINNIMTESLKNEDKSFNNQYLKFFDRQLVKSRVDYVQRFVDHYVENSDKKLNLFSELNTNHFISKPIVLKPKTNNYFDIGGRISIKFELNIIDAVNQGFVSGLTKYETGSLSNWKLDTSDGGEEYKTEPFVIYD